MVSTCHVLALLLCIGSVLEAQALLLKAAPAVIAAPAPTSSTRKLTKEEAGFLLDDLVGKMNIPNNKAAMVTAMANPEPEKAATIAAVPILHDAMTKLGFRDDEILEAFADAVAMAEADPILALKLQELTTILKGAPLSLLFHAKAMVIKAAPAAIAAPAPTSSNIRQLTNSEAAEFLDMMIDSLQKPGMPMKLATALKGPNPQEATRAVAEPLMYDSMAKLGFRVDQVDEVISQTAALAETDPTLALKLKTFTAAMEKEFSPLIDNLKRQEKALKVLLLVKAVFSKAAPAVIAAPAPLTSKTRKLKKEEASFLLDGLLEKIQKPENMKMMVAAMADPDPEKAAARAAVTLMHDGMTRIGLRDDEMVEVMSQVVEIADADPDLAEKLEAYTAMIMGSHLSLLSHAQAIDFKPWPAKKLTKSEATELLDMIVATMEKPESRKKMAEEAALALGRVNRATIEYASDFEPDKYAWRIIKPDFVKCGYRQKMTPDSWFAQLVAYAEMDPVFDLKYRHFQALVDGDA